MSTTNAQLSEWRYKQVCLAEYLDSDDILKLEDEELTILTNLEECLQAYCKILRKKLASEQEARDSIIKLEAR